MTEDFINLTKVWVDSANTSTLYWTFLKRGRLKGLSKEVSVIISKRHPRDKHLCTDTSLISAREALSLYFTLVFLTLTYLSWRRAEEGAKSISEVIALHST